MSDSRTYQINLDPVPCPRPRVGKFGTYYPAKYSRWRKDFHRELRRVVGDKTPFNSQLTVSLWFFAKKPKSTKLSHPKPDIDNFVKAVFDGCNGIVWNDDSQVVMVDASKHWTNTPQCFPKIVIQIQTSSGTSRAKSVDQKTT
jgi:Holliday junction resolvase RusA-like endonuclease